ncbi:membrane dipeptidase [Streptomyces sp. NPDC006339]|uniref:membrane dipeptidase n=1 Tax=Streptomyces sp. NPDC006339 TaxID=3156755 RepID=UPI00339F0EC0
MADLLDDPTTTAPAPALGGEAADAPAAAGDLDPPEGPGPVDEPARARALLAARPVVEGHTEPPGVIDLDLPLDPDPDPEDLPPVRAAEAGAQFWSLRVDTGDVVLGTLRRIDAVRALVAAFPEELRLAHTTSEMAHARNCGRVAVLLGPVSWSAVAGSPATLRAYHALGVRAVGLTRFDGFAREAVREMNRLGLLVDLAGADADTVRQALAVSRAPVLLTRADPDGLPDDVLRLLGEKGGVCMVPVTTDEAATADHLDRVRGLAGPWSLGLSHAESPSAGYAPLFGELLRRGWLPDQLAALAQGNVTRVLRETEFRARASRPT